MNSGNSRKPFRTIACLTYRCATVDREVNKKTQLTHFHLIPDKVIKCLTVSKFLLLLISIITNTLLRRVESMAGYPSKKVAQLWQCVDWKLPAAIILSFFSYRCKFSHKKNINCLLFRSEILLLFLIHDMEQLLVLFLKAKANLWRSFGDVSRYLLEDSTFRIQTQIPMLSCTHKFEPPCYVEGVETWLLEHSSLSKKTKFNSFLQLNFHLTQINILIQHSAASPLVKRQPLKPNPLLLIFCSYCLSVVMCLLSLSCVLYCTVVSFILIIALWYISFLFFLSYFSHLFHCLLSNLLFSCQSGFFVKNYKFTGSKGVDQTKMLKLTCRKSQEASFVTPTIVQK
ncbi:hypothetical protein VP01_2773g1 [Puccinia sorghi]|uniref:Uncharacterized protein n=1 Tax=Puccinia sorghi TaxID=27349 RepID=A0A0L6V3H3_9BASI|nr:hypothetical protein VP01_2773g1 [Puccinia sorghi]